MGFPPSWMPEAPLSVRAGWTLDRYTRYCVSKVLYSCNAQAQPRITWEVGSCLEFGGDTCVRLQSTTMLEPWLTHLGHGLKLR